MTDKQIIIDEIDVSGCEFAPKEIGWCNNGNLSSYCKENPNCYYKQHKQAEQRIVELNKTIQAKEKECEELKKWKETAKDLFDKTCSCKYLNKENAHCSLYNKECVAINQCLYKNQQTLTEIKEIAEPYQKDIDKICGNCRRYDGCHACCMDTLNNYEYRTGTTKACDKFIELKDFDINKLANQILQKIIEVEK